MVERMNRRMTYSGVGRTEEEAAEAKLALKRSDIPTVEMTGLEGLSGEDVDHELKVRLEEMLGIAYEMNTILVSTSGGAVPETFANYFRDHLFTLVGTLDDLRDGSRRRRRRSAASSCRSRDAAAIQGRGGSSCGGGRRPLSN